MSDDFRVPSGRRTWRPPLSYRVALTLVVSVLVGAAAGYSWVTLSSNQLHGEVVLAVAVPLWALFAFRIWTVSATLSQDTLVIRNVLSTERVLVADITRVAFSGRILKVTERRPPLPLGPSPVTALGAAFPRHRDSGQRYAVSAVQLGLMASISGSRCEADDAAGLIAAAAGLPGTPRARNRRQTVRVPAHDSRRYRGNHVRHRAFRQGASRSRTPDRGRRVQRNWSRGRIHSYPRAYSGSRSLHPPPPHSTTQKTLNPGPVQRAAAAAKVVAVMSCPNGYGFLCLLHDPPAEVDLRRVTRKII